MTAGRGFRPGIINVWALQGEREMSFPELTTVAEGNLPGGQIRILRADGLAALTPFDPAGHPPSP